ncbi:MAG: TolC family protein, partial [Caldiserica bacterium]|nr:TolC family protein [Caldisericota bacterium]
LAEGMVAEVDVLRAKVALANANQQLINAENGLKFARAYFNNLLNRDLGEEVKLKDMLEFEDNTGNLSTYITEAYKNRPEIKEMKNRLRMAEEKVKIARASFFPQVALTGSWDKKKGAEIPIDKWKESWSAVISVSMDIWDWGENKKEFEKAKSQMEQLKNSFSLLKNQIELEVRQAYLNLLSARQRIKVQEEAVKEAEKNFKDTSARFKEGMATNTDVLDARTLLTRAEIDYYRALYGYQIAKAGLERAVGNSAASQKGEKR